MGRINWSMGLWRRSMGLWSSLEQGRIGDDGLHGICLDFGIEIEVAYGMV